MFKLSLILSLVSFSLSAQTIDRVISLAPSTTELAYAAGLGDKLVAVSEHSDYPEQAKLLETIANYQSINVERIIALQPDLIIAWPGGNPAKELDKLAQFGFTIYNVKTKSLEDIALNVEQLSQYADDPTVGEQVASHFRSQLAAYQQQYNTDEKISYFYQLSEKPIITVAQDRWPSEVFRFCGGVNVFENSAAPYPQVGLEQVIVANPQVIFTSRHAIENSGMWQSWQEQLQAIKQQQIWTLNSSWINRPTPRTLDAIEQVCELFETVRQKQ
ncbi:vitamin B12 ABC transporter B12-binding component BtuF [Vibrio ichthyoenteri ATCC 700023]|uniref:Vitamin B12-binding protein n=1 Tax=Vibrio ichthyoenteri ATCC 700023 TaxID=870968 RepID=F9S8Y6_9VIBR|nr:vitamin B12 ABC transporter substrate-binding protein BtuF [Vibrio ichthyoenteri]EGU29039.1 vitamin B12 ABC transporter B12-binding component BtuF [Vibrio ichthyoenteri ATCC 700023]